MNVLCFLYEWLHSLFDVCFDAAHSLASVSLGEGRFSGRCDYIFVFGDCRVRASCGQDACFLHLDQCLLIALL